MGAGVSSTPRKGSPENSLLPVLPTWSGGGARCAECSQNESRATVAEKRIAELEEILAREVALHKDTKLQLESLKLASTAVAIKETGHHGHELTPAQRVRQEKLGWRAGFVDAKASEAEVHEINLAEREVKHFGSTSDFKGKAPISMDPMKMNEPFKGKRSSAPYKPTNAQVHKLSTNRDGRFGTLKRTQSGCLIRMAAKAAVAELKRCESSQELHKVKELAHKVVGELDMVRKEGLGMQQALLDVRKEMLSLQTDVLKKEEELLNQKRNTDEINHKLQEADCTINKLQEKLRRNVPDLISTAFSRAVKNGLSGLQEGSSVEDTRAALRKVLEVLAHPRQVTSRPEFVELSDLKWEERIGGGSLQEGDVKATARRHAVMLRTYLRTTYTSACAEETGDTFTSSPSQTKRESKAPKKQACKLFWHAKRCCTI